MQICCEYDCAGFVWTGNWEWKKIKGENEIDLNFASEQFDGRGILINFFTCSDQGKHERIFSQSNLNHLDRNPSVFSTIPEKTPPKLLKRPKNFLITI